MEVVLLQMCKSIDGPLSVEMPSRSRPDVTHTVSGLFYERAIPSCTCEAYKFAKYEDFHGVMRKRPCYHILKAQGDACGWHQQYSKEGQTPEQRQGDICPRCGGPTVYVKVLV